MIVREFLKQLLNYNLDADINIVVGSAPKEFEICYGSAEGCSPKNCDSVSLYAKGNSNDN